MKKIFTFIFVLCLGFVSMAQDVVLYDFNDSTQLDDWEVIVNPSDTVSGFNWHYDEDMGVVYSTIYLGNTPDFRIESPIFDVSEFDISAVYQFALGAYSFDSNTRSSISVYVIIDDMEYPRLQYNLKVSDEWVWVCDTIANLVNYGWLDLENSRTFRVAIEFNTVSNANALVMLDDFKLHKRNDKALLHFVGPEGGGTMDDYIRDTTGYFFMPAPEYEFPENNVFLFWYVIDMDGNDYILYEDDSIWVNGDMIIYAQWGAEYTVSYYENDGSSDTPTDVEDAIQYLGHVVLDMGYTRDHYVFAGYNTEPDGTGLAFAVGDTLDLITNAAGVILSTEMNLYAQWTPIMVTIHYDANGGQGTMADTSVVEDSDFDVEDCRFYRTGYGFDHWNTQANDEGIDYAAGETLNTDEDITLYAQWSPVPTITISFDLGDALDILPDTTVNAGYDFVIPEYTLKYDGYTFVGWKDVDLDRVYYTGDTINYDDDITLTAVWEAVPMATVTFNAGSADAQGVMRSATFPAANQYTIPQCTFTVEGYSFAGWYEQTNDTVYQPGDVVEFEEGDYVLVARWNALPTVTVTFDANGNATGVMMPLSVYLDSVFDLPYCDFERSGYTFAGWNTKADGSGVAFTDHQQVSFSTDTTLYAQWEEIPIVYHSISFNANGGVGSMNSVEVEDSRVFALPECSFTREGYTFAGWCTDANGNGDTLAVGEEYYVGQDRTFYAVWIAEETEGIANLSMAAMTIGPNPATAMVNVSGVNVNRLTIFSVNGQRLRTVNATSSISLDGMPTGVYMLQVNAAEGTAMRRIVKK
ncbi:MAG: InlB B-repeat-containing protein [Bacteroidales bacterium]|nr:InlB B-repeat-containing protein [Bacteroidales bacterium]